LTVERSQAHNVLVSFTIYHIC